MTRARFSVSVSMFHFRCNCARRYQIALLSSVGFLLSFGIRCNMGVAVLEMTKNETKDLDGDGVIRADIYVVLF